MAVSAGAQPRQAHQQQQQLLYLLRQPDPAALRAGRLPGYEGLPNAKAAEALSKYIIVDMYAKAVQGTPPEEAVKLSNTDLYNLADGRQLEADRLSERYRSRG